MNQAVVVYQKPKAPAISVERQLARHADQPLPAYLDKSQVHALIDAATKERDKLLIMTCWRTGGRISEVLGIRRCDFQMDAIRLRNLKQRGYSEKIVPVAADYGLAFLAYCEARGITGTDYIFTAKKSKRPISRVAAYQIIRACADRAGLVLNGRDPASRYVHPHTLRHSCAVHLLGEGVPITAVQRVLGHASMLTTTIYTKLSDATIKHFVGQVAF